MRRTSTRPMRRGAAFILLLTLCIAACVLLASEAGLRKSAAAGVGYPQLISVKALPPQIGQECQWEPAGNSDLFDLPEWKLASTSTLLQTPPAANAESTVRVDRAPIRAIHDNYPAFSAVAVYNNSDEVILQDENTFGINTYNRMDNTPATAAFTEPKRRISGPKTTIEFNCGLYVDPKNGDIYSLNNDTNQALAVFPHDGKGDMTPKRLLKTPQATFGLAVDDDNNEIYITVQENNTLVVYRKEADGKEPPIREINGNKTQLADPHGVAVDSKANLIFVNNTGSSFALDKDARPIPGSGSFHPPSIVVYPRTGSGDIAPIRVIQGPKTQLNWPAAMTVDPEHGELYVASDVDNSILVFRETDSGDVAPIRQIKGPKSGVKNPTGVFVDLKHDEVWSANLGNHTATVYKRTANGDVAPLRTIRAAAASTPSLMFNNPAGIAYDNKRDELLIPN